MHLSPPLDVTLLEILSTLLAPCGKLEIVRYRSNFVTICSAASVTRRRLPNTYRPKPVVLTWHDAVTRSSAIVEGPRDASCQLKSCQLPWNSAQTTSTTSPEQIEVMKLEGYSGTMCNKHVYSTMTRSSRFHCLIGVINKPTTDRVVEITCIPTTCCGEIS